MAVVTVDSALEIVRLKRDLNELLRDLGLLGREVRRMVASHVAEECIGERRGLSDPPGHL